MVWLMVVSVPQGASLLVVLLDLGVLVKPRAGSG